MNTPTNKDKRNVADRLIALVEKEAFLMTGVKGRNHAKGNCVMNDIIGLVQDQIAKAEFSKDKIPLKKRSSKKHKKVWKKHKDKSG